jgi:hypothetical protein
MARLEVAFPLPKGLEGSDLEVKARKDDQIPSDDDLEDAIMAMLKTNEGDYDDSYGEPISV